MEGLHGEFDIERYHQRKKNFVLPAFGVNVYAGSTNQRSDIPHPLLHQKLRKLRDTICSKADLPIYIVAGTNTLDEMARYLPQSLSEMKDQRLYDAKKKYGHNF
jgi:superfamily II DNA helicase RecQ